MFTRDSGGKNYNYMKNNFERVENNLKSILIRDKYIQ